MSRLACQHLDIDSPPDQGSRFGNVVFESYGFIFSLINLGCRIFRWSTAICHLSRLIIKQPRFMRLHNAVPTLYSEFLREVLPPAVRPIKLRQRLTKSTARSRKFRSCE